MTEWKEVILSEVTSIIGDGLHGTPSYSDDGDYYFINGNNLNQGKVIIKSDTKRVTEEEAKKYAKPLSDKTILLSINGTIGNLALYSNEKCMLGKSACYINVNDENDRKFLYYVFLNRDFQSFIVENATGTTIPNVPLKGLRDYTFNLPPLPEQKAIAETLSSLDDKIDLLHRQNKTLEQMAETLFRQWFLEEEVNLKPLGECIQTTSGGTPSRKNMDYYENGTVQWIKSKELNRGYLLDTEEKITEDAINNSSAKILPKNSVLIAMYGATVGEYAIIGQQATCNQAICACIPNKDFPYTYIYYTIKANEEELINMAVGSAQQNISQVLIKGLDIPVDETKIKLFHEEVDPMMKKIKLNYKHMNNLKNMRDTLLPKLMSGEVTVQ
jgi:type I restriction enzyme S subunit